MEGLRNSLMIPAAGTIFMVYGCVDALMRMVKIRYSVKDENGKMLLPHPYKPWVVPAGKEEEAEGAYRSFKMYENVKEWTMFSMPLMWIFSVYGGAIPYTNRKPWILESVVGFSTAAWVLGNKWYIDGYIKSSEDRLVGFQTRTRVFRFWFYGSLVSLVCSGLERFDVSLPGK